MSLNKAKQTYNVLLKSGDLLELFPDLCGLWSKDKEEFLEMFELNTDIIGEN